MAKKEKDVSPVSEKKQSKVKTKDKKPGFFARLKKWAHDLNSEAKKVVWPTRKQTINNSAIVIAAILIIGVFIWILDAVFNLGITTLITISAV
jgi:preprotein translocase subunit SecE